MSMLSLLFFTFSKNGHCCCVHYHSFVEMLTYSPYREDYRIVLHNANWHPCGQEYCNSRNVKNSIHQTCITHELPYLFKDRLGSRSPNLSFQVFRHTQKYKLPN